MTQTMTGLTLIAGQPATYDLQDACVFTTQEEARRVGLRLFDLGDIDSLTIIPKGDGWIVRQRHCPSNKYLAEVKVVDARPKGPTQVQRTRARVERADDALAAAKDELMVAEREHAKALDRSITAKLARINS